jgi:nitroreductase / dihydropteridine reductase
MEFKDIVKERYAVKLFTKEKLPEEKVAALLDIIRHAPSSWNIQTWKIKIIDDEETLKKLHPASYEQTQILSCSHLLVFCAETDLNKAVDDLEILFEEKTGKKPTHTDSIRKSYNSMSKQDQECYAKQQVFLALGNAVNGAKSLGFDSCPMGGFKADEYSKILNLPKSIIPVALCPIGYAADKPREKIRFSKEDIVI